MLNLRYVRILYAQCTYKIHFNKLIPDHTLASGKPGLMDINADSLFTFNTSSHSRGHPYKLYKARCTSTVRQNFFANRVMNVWNSLPTTVRFDSLANFKRSLSLYFCVFFSLFIFILYFVYEFIINIH